MRGAKGAVEIVPLTAARMDDLATVLRGTWGSGCWCMHPRMTASIERALPGPGGGSDRRRRAMTALARKRRAPGLLAYRRGEVSGWVAIAPRPELARVEASTASPRVDSTDVWVIPCITVRRKARRQGVAVALLAAAVRYAARHGAPAVEAYPRADHRRVHDDYAYMGTETLFRRAGFRVIRGRLPGLAASRIPRVTMRRLCRRSR